MEPGIKNKHFVQRAYKKREQSIISYWSDAIFMKFGIKKVNLQFFPSSPKYSFFGA